MDDDRERDAQAVGHELLESLAGVVAVGTLGVGVTSAVLGYGSLTAPIFVVGWLLVLPLVGVLSENTAAQSFVGRLAGGATSERDRQTVDEGEVALEELKRRYARGEIDEAEFEDRTAMLLENESIEDVTERVDRTTHDDHPNDESRERDPEPAYET